MRDWNSPSLPPKYRSIAKRYAAIEITIKSKNLSDPCPDFSSLTAKERDIMEVYFHCLFHASCQKSSATSRSIKNPSFEKDINFESLRELLSQSLSTEEINTAHNIMTTLPHSRRNEIRHIFGREHRPKLIAYLMDQQKLTTWLPIAKLDTEHITWTAWEELLHLATAHGYDRSIDDTSEMPFISLWDDKAKDQIFHLMLEMIDPKDVHRVWTEEMGRDRQDLVSLRYRPELLRRS